MYLEKVLVLMEKLKYEAEKERLTDYLNEMSRHINVATRAILALESGERGDVIGRFNADTIAAHDKMCEAMDSINNLAKAYGLEKIYEFDLEPVIKNERIIGYSQRNHLVTDDMASITLKEIDNIGKIIIRNKNELNKLKQEQVEEAKRRPLPQLTFEDIKRAANSFSERHFQLDSLLEKHKDGKIDIALVKNNVYFMVSQSDEYSVNLENISGKIDNLELEYYLDGNNAYDVPKSLIRDIIEENQGFNINRIKNRDELFVDAIINELGKASLSSKNYLDDCLDLLEDKLNSSKNFYIKSIVKEFDKGSEINAIFIENKDEKVDGISLNGELNGKQKTVNINFRPEQIRDFENIRMQKDITKKIDNIQIETQKECIIVNKDIKKAIKEESER